MARSDKAGKNPIEVLLQDKREEILRIAEKHGACNVRVFGSVVHGEATDNSDIDLLVDTSEKTSPWFPAGLIEELEQVLGSVSRGHKQWSVLVAASPDTEGGAVIVKKDPRVYMAHILECAAKIE